MGNTTHLEDRNDGPRGVELELSAKESWRIKRVGESKEKSETDAYH